MEEEGREEADLAFPVEEHVLPVQALLPEHKLVFPCKKIIFHPVCEDFFGNISSIVIIMRFPTEKWVMTKSGAQKLWEKGKIALLSKTELQRI